MAHDREGRGFTCGACSMRAGRAPVRGGAGDLELERLHRTLQVEDPARRVLSLGECEPPPLVELVGELSSVVLGLSEVCDGAIRQISRAADAEDQHDAESPYPRPEPREASERIRSMLEVGRLRAEPCD